MTQCAAFYVKNDNKTNVHAGWYNGPIKSNRSITYEPIDDQVFNNFKNNNSNKKVMLISSKNEHIRDGPNGIFYFEDSNNVLTEKYIGDWKNNVRHGKGKHIYLDNSTYDGDWEKDLRNGTGIYVQKDNLNNIIYCYDGNWKDDVKYGKGKINYPSGISYDGNWENDKANGLGTFKKLNSIYIGQFLDDKRHGNNGVYEFKNEGITEYKYIGQWKNDKFNGEGTITYKNGDEFSGSWEDNNMIIGIMTYSDNTIYNGNFLNNMKHGMGSMIYTDTNSFYDGPWENNKRHGDNGKITRDNNDYFICRWEDDKPVGDITCKLTLPNGDVFEGKIIDNITFDTISNTIIGDSFTNGKMIYLNGDIYIGDFKNNKRHGNGKITYSEDDSEYDGCWCDDLKHGNGTMINNTIKIEGYWINDEFPEKPTITTIKRKLENNSSNDSNNKSLCR